MKGPRLFQDVFFFSLFASHLLQAVALAQSQPLQHNLAESIKDPSEFPLNDTCVEQSSKTHERSSTDDDQHQHQTTDHHKKSNNKMSALARSRAIALEAPQPKLSHGGEYENTEYWSSKHRLFQQARNEWGRRHPELYNWNHKMVQLLDPDFFRAIKTRNKTWLLSNLIESTNVPNVYTIRLFGPKFAELLLEELQHHEASGIPLRRPNGMNRFGAILSDLGFQEMFNGFVSDYLKPVAHLLFPDIVGPDDLKENYPFIVKYRPGQDVSLSEHTDASTVTVNICLQASSTEQNVLYFKEQRSWKTLVEPIEPQFVDLIEPGRAVIHLGQHVHGVSEVQSPRSNLVIWMYGKYGYVRVAPYAPKEVQKHQQEFDKFWNKGITGKNTSTARNGRKISELIQEDL